MSRTVAEFLVDTLINHGIDQLYCLPGVQNDVFFDALYHRTGQLTPIHTRHEQGAAYMAMGAALATGKPQACCVVPGPGFLNASAALCTAYAVNAPVLAIVGQIPLGAIEAGHGLLHEVPGQLDTLQTLCKQAHRVSGGDHCEVLLQGAMAALVTGRPRPVGVEVPVNVWGAEVDSAGSASADGLEKPELDEDSIAQAVALIKASDNPLIVVGGGALNHSAAVTDLVDRIGAPVVSFRNGHGVVSSDHPMEIGMPVAHRLWSKVDLVIGLGTRLQSQVMSWGQDDNLRVIHIDIDDAEIGRNADVTVGVHADLKDALPMLLAALDDSDVRRDDWRSNVADAKQVMAQQYRQRLPEQLAWLDAIRSELPRDGIFVDELTQVGYVSRFTFPVYSPRTFISTGYQGTLGYGFATALGVAHARRDVPVVSISGDGGALFTISELATAVHHKIPLTTVVFNDNAFGNVRLLQKDNYGARHIADSLTSPDFVKLAESFGAQGLLATTPQQLRECLRAGLDWQGPTIIEVPVGEMPSPWDFVRMPKVRGG